MITNFDIAEQLQKTARELTSQQANLFRIRAYRTAANLILSLDRPVDDLIREEGKDFLRYYPGLGEHLIETITQFARTGVWKMFDELKPNKKAKRVGPSIQDNQLV